MTTRNQYLALRRRYEPERVRLVIIAESPPASGKYFYNPEGVISEALFSALMKQLQFSPRTKDEGLRAFKRNGWVLVDATYEPVNKLTGSSRDRAIEQGYPLLRDDLASLMPDRSAPLILIKENVCRILKPKLVQDGFNVLNGDRVIYFPSTGRQKNFHQQFAAVLKSAGVFSLSQYPLSNTKMQKR
jgi:hypothetical protein